MISNRKDLKSYLEQDAKVMGLVINSLIKKYSFFYLNELWRFHVLLRKYEFLKNRKKNLYSFFLYQIARYRYKMICIKLGFSIPPNVLGPGCYIPHYGTIIINSNAKIGKNCLIHAGVVIGANGGGSKAPQIGDNVFIGPGSKIYGDIVIADNVYIGANSVVNKSFLEKNAVLAGIPSKVINFSKLNWWEKNRLKL